ncbi:MAG TPA: flagellar hook-basal body complex protein FliE [Rugosimonospora sp.]|nr:flagellar hook-basal body complex protein FliE [Rugosimonospora sp.]
MTVIPPIGPVTAIAPVTSSPATSPASGTNFASMLANGLNQVQQLQTNADNLAVQAATGTLNDPAQYTIASTQATLATELTVAIRDKALDAFNEIMRMQA